MVSLIGPAYSRLQHKLYTWRPRPDRQDENDEQTSFVESKALVSWMLGGNGSGKSEAGAAKTARLLCYEQPPPRVDTPFWVISDTYEMSCGMGWVEKLSKFIPADMIDWNRIHWKNSNEQYPYSVPLMPWSNGNNWKLEFKSYKQGRRSMQARSIGGCWFSEQVPMKVFEEVFRGAREYMFPGSVFAEMTPIDPIMAVEAKRKYDNPPVGWKFFHLNTRKNIEAGGVKREWGESFFASVSAELLETRSVGAFAGYEGVIFPMFKFGVHTVENITLPPGCIHYRAIDWGASHQHPFVCLWMAEDGAGRWYVYDEYTSRRQVGADVHAQEILARHDWKGKDPHFYRSGFADPSSPGDFDIMRRAGIPLNGAINLVQPGIETVRMLLGDPRRGLLPKVFIDRTRCPMLIEQLPTVRWVLGSEKGLNPALPVPKVLKINDDAFDAFRYCVHTVIMQRHAEGIKSLGRPNPRDLVPRR